MEIGALGKTYKDGEMIFRQGDPGDRMFVILAGKVEVFLERNEAELPLKLVREGEFLGVRALFGDEEYSTSARSDGLSRLLAIDKKSFMRRILEDPTIAYRLVHDLSMNVLELEQDVAVLSSALQEVMSDVNVITS